MCHFDGHATPGVADEDAVVALEGAPSINKILIDVDAVVVEPLAGLEVVVDVPVDVDVEPVDAVEFVPIALNPPTPPPPLDVAPSTNRR